MNFKNDKGSVSILIITLSLIMLTLMPVIGFVSEGWSTANRLNNAADRIALGAATNLITNPEVACDAAMQLATANSVELYSCEVSDSEVLIKVKTIQKIQSWLDRWPRIGMARAGIDYVFY